MTSFADALWIAAALAGTAGLPDATAALARATADATARIAASWRVESQRVRIDWGTTPPASPAEAELRKLSGRGRDGWYVAVLQDAEGRPLSLRLRAGLEDTVWVAARALEGGAVVAPGDLRPEARVCWGGPGERRAARPGPGWKVNRPLAPGEVASPPAVTPPLAVQAGDEVRLEWRRDLVVVSASGIALNAAREGEKVRVRVRGRNEPLVGRARARGEPALLEEVWR